LPDLPAEFGEIAVLIGGQVWIDAHFLYRITIYLNTGGRP
jgi:hypothetical protein